MPKAPAHQGKSSWARAPEREVKVTQSDGPLPKGPFKPILNSNKESVKLRKKVKSSSYGKKAAKKKVMTENIPTREEQELEGATFRPKLSKSKESIAMRKKAASSAYGKVAARPKTARRHSETPTFRPEIGISPSARLLLKTVGSSGYGKLIAERKPKMAKEAITFQPNMDFGVNSAKIRARAPSGTYLQARERPQTAPTLKAERVQMYTLLADKTPVSDDEEEDEDKVPFNLNLWQVEASAKAGGVIPCPAPVLELKTSRDLKKQTPSSGYASEDGAYQPKQGERVLKEKVAHFKFGNVDEIYADTPDKVALVARQSEQRKMFEKAQPSGYGPNGKYEPKHVVIHTSQHKDKAFVVPARADTNAMGGVAADDMPMPSRNKTMDRVPSSMYGKTTPPVTPRAVASPKSTPMKMGTATTALLPVSMLGTAAERDLACVRAITGNVFEGEQTSILASDN